ncbi:hypothetical protein K493DRAFT_357265 [Basidiobolus meristosporus CBS 931.73]|uniref:Uncharacterized protein n=1 Tax=Basidiobolus meristosporus CBS 931.73 TaxID=1314790 RepID=A0A1Y1XWF8_9FUNG|nr:hypothetical protein K493DRAFT_357265 [Basidiobolus meristosporus CBS 931.73]|eukprot:ORX90089.1 hypothetical protein K493DRAFT_357265 [Basidiobolus meristosporus CBS 931.73]
MDMAQRQVPLMVDANAGKLRQRDNRSTAKHQTAKRKVDSGPRVAEHTINELSPHLKQKHSAGEHHAPQRKVDARPRVVAEYIVRGITNVRREESGNESGFEEVHGDGLYGDVNMRFNVALCTFIALLVFTSVVVDAQGAKGQPAAKGKKGSKQ